MIDKMFLGKRKLGYSYKRRGTGRGGYKKSTRPFKRFRRSYRRRGLSSNVHMFKRYAQTTEEVSGTGPSIIGAEKFTLDSVAGYSELTALYDQYKISAVVVRFHLINNPDAQNLPNSTTLNYANIYPKLWYYRDYDDGNALSLTQMKEVGKVKCKILRPNSMISVKLKPAVKGVVYSTSSTTGYSAQWPSKLDMNYAAIEHFGLKWVIDAENTTLGSGTFKVRIETLYYLKCFNSR